MTYHDLKLIRIKNSDFCLQVELIINLNKSSATAEAVFSTLRSHAAPQRLRIDMQYQKSQQYSSSNIIGNKILQEYDILLMPRRVLSVSSL